MSTGKQLLSLIAKLLLCLSVGPLALLSAAGASVGKPNVILVLIDDQLDRQGVQLLNFHVDCFRWSSGHRSNVD